MQSAAMPLRVPDAHLNVGSCLMVARRARMFSAQSAGKSCCTSCAQWAEATVGDCTAGSMY